MMSVYETAVKIIRPFAQIYHRLETRGLENIPTNATGFVIAANHTNWFGWDAMMISASMPDRKIKWVAWSDPEKMPGWHKQVMAFDCIVHNKKMKFPYEQISAEVSGGGVVGMFPEGSNNTVFDWYRLRPFIPGCVKLAAMAGAPILPVSVAGVEEASPIFWIGEADGEAPSELFALPALFPTKVTVRIGNPIDVKLRPEQIEDKDALRAEAEKIRTAVLQLLQNDRPKAYAMR